ncbi:MAG TPA: site-specific DNA-methyltransferase [Aggregatilineales bacterium]|nr:site-specific DNA-methyltransferase [Anaerolineales bacterium]HRE48347.1 site-specific DNA-methyltransferase [Aggregatilineales bacterium]
MDTLPLFPTPYTISNHDDSTAAIILYEGDVNGFLPTIPDQSVNLIITSPPYNLGKVYEKRTAIESYLATQAETIRELVRILHPNGSLCWQVGNYVDDGEVFPLDMFYYPLFKGAGLALRNRIVWHFGHGLHASKRFSGRYETLLWFTKSDHYIFNLDPVRVPSKYPGKRHYKGPNLGKPSGNPKGKNPSDVWEIMADEWALGMWDIPNVKSNHSEKTPHPCQFPVELAERCVLALTNEGDRVFDPYAGVGSSLIAALKHNRRAIGAEKEPAYVGLAKERIAAFYSGELRLRAIGTPIHEPTGREKVAQVPKEWGEEG